MKTKSFHPKLAEEDAATSKNQKFDLFDLKCEMNSMKKYQAVEKEIIRWKMVETLKNTRKLNKIEQSIPI
jgi:hypothetical protein